MSKMNRKGRNTHTLTPFVAVLKATMEEPAWKDLPYGARWLYVAVKSFYNGHTNNGRIYLSVRKAAEMLGASTSSTERWFDDLVDHGFLAVVEEGYLGIDGKGKARYWRLTEVGYMNDPPSRDYKNWKPSKNKIPSPKSGHVDPKIATPPSPKSLHPTPKSLQQAAENCETAESARSDFRDVSRFCQAGQRSVNVVPHPAMTAAAEKE